MSDSALHVLLDPPLPGPENMARDEHLLYARELAPARLRIYAWAPATLSLGYFQSAAEIDKLAEEVRRLPFVRRLTGGGAILHDQEITYCLVLDDSLPLARRAPAELYRAVHECWRAALALDGIETELAPESAPLPSPRSGPFYCFEKPGRTDLLIGGDKVLGSAQRRIPGFVMQHGSLILDRRFASHPGAHLQNPPQDVRERWIERFVELVAGALSLQTRRIEWTAECSADIARRRARYSDPAWNSQR